MVRYKPYKYDQMVMVPISFQEQLEPGTFEYTLNAMVEHLPKRSIPSCYSR
jgi:hypothetical protein